ncbi:AraC family transcriptional regulator [Niveispirillum sp. KHB5.9]|uniref:AraC family transcriptional regulator n=1 Tax=Niveispirillum sp. KHB5.9 TaxID=3400269 RepID=UPI003A885EA0
MSILSPADRVGQVEPQASPDSIGTVACQGSPAARPDLRYPPGDWADLRRDAETGIESIRAHFTGHAYDMHDHDELLLGVTEQGVQSFRCGRQQVVSIPGRAILIEPGQPHDGHSPEPAGFTYQMLYLPLAWVQASRDTLSGPLAPLGFRQTLWEDAGLCHDIAASFRALHGREGRLARDLALDRLLGRLWQPDLWRQEPHPASRPHRAARRARDALHDHMADDIGLEELAGLSGIDRFRLHRQFREAFGRSPHAYLVQLRLKRAKALLAAGGAPADVAASVGFADQSHLGRWFRRAYGTTPATYRQICTNIPDGDGLVPAS